MVNEVPDDEQYLTGLLSTRKNRKQLLNVIARTGNFLLVYGTTSNRPGIAKLPDQESLCSFFLFLTLLPFLFSLSTFLYPCLACSLSIRIGLPVS